MMRGSRVELAIADTEFILYKSYCAMVAQPMCTCLSPDGEGEEGGHAAITKKRRGGEAPRHLVGDKEEEDGMTRVLADTPHSFSPTPTVLEGKGLRGGRPVRWCNDGGWLRALAAVFYLSLMSE
jgi:hypothetical protein